MTPSDPGPRRAVATVEPLAPADLDVLRELASIGAGQALTALAKLLDRRVTMTVPEAWVERRAGDVGEFLSLLGAQLVAVGVKLEGLLTGELLVALTEDDAGRLALALGEPVVTADLDAAWNPLAESALLESGNIVGSAFVSAVARIVGGRLLLSVPALAHGTGRTCLQKLAPCAPGRVALATRFEVGGIAGFRGLVLVTPAPASLPALLARLRAAS